MRLFDCFIRKTSTISVHGPMSIAASIFLLISFLATSSYAFASQASQLGSRAAATPRHTVTGHIAPMPAKSNVRLNNTAESLAFDDEFNAPAINTNIWNAEDDSPGRYQNCCFNTGLQYYTKDAIALSDGALHIQTSKASMGNKQYTSGALTTENKFSFLYGRVDIRARLPKGKGIWPSLWLQDSSTDHEVDLMETINNDTSIYQTYHMKASSTSTTFQCIVPVADPSTDFHVYSLVWYPTSLTWYIDDTETCQMTTFVPQDPMYLLINTAVGGRWAGPPDSTTTFPQKTDLDYVHVYQTPPLNYCSGLVVNKPLRLNVTTITRGNMVYATVGYRNDCTIPFTITNLTITAHNADGTDVVFPNKFDPVTLSLRESILLTASLPIQSTDPTGQWYVFTSFQTPDGLWHTDGTNLFYFTVTA